MNRFIKKYSLVLNVALIVLLIGIAFGFVLISNKRSSEISRQAEAESLTSVDTQIATLTRSIKANPEVAVLYINLSQAYLQKIRDTADSSYYQKIVELMDQAEMIDPQHPEIPAIRASVEIGKHNFKKGYEYATKAIALNPQQYLNYGLLGDALIELGRYKEATEAFQKMVDIRPDYSSYIRIAYIRELYGDSEGAKQALELAIESGSSYKENVAFAYVELGKLLMREDLKKASTAFLQATALVKEYPPALEGMGKIAFFEKDYAKAEEYFQSAYTKLPIVQYAVDLGDLYTKQGNTTKAQQYFALAQIAFSASVKSGVNTDLEESLFLSDHDLDLQRALVLAERAYKDRPSIYTADHLAWALYKNGDYKKAATYSKDALRLGETDPLILFHQGMIALKNGNTAVGKKYLIQSLKINPYFSLLDTDNARVALENN